MELENHASLIVVGGGPSGLRAAEVAAEAGMRVELHERNPYPGRKFLVAGRGGLNLTNSEDRGSFSKRYQGSFCHNFWTSLLEDFDQTSLRRWAEDLSITTFVGSSGRVFPDEKKAAPLLRAWISRLKTLGVDIRSRSKLTAWERQNDRFILTFQTPEGTLMRHAKAVLFALGGASWPQTGSDAAWISSFHSHGIPFKGFESANCGWEHHWNPDIIPQIEGRPLKNLAMTVGDETLRGELLITRYGLEGGLLYQFGHRLRKMQSPEIHIDFKPDFSLQSLLAKLPSLNPENPKKFLRSWKVSETACHLILNLLFSSQDTPPVQNRMDPGTVARLVKDFPLALTRPRPIAEAISSAGGVEASALDDSLMVRKFPGLFLAGEMLDWEAPTGGYLLQGCFSTATRAAAAAVTYLKQQN